MKIQINGILLMCVISLSNISVVYAQELVLYKLDSIERPYTLVRQFRSENNIDVSEVITAKTLNVLSNKTQIEFVFSNAIIFSTTIKRESSPSSVANIKQDVMAAGKFDLPLEKTQKIIFNGKISVVEKFDIHTIKRELQIEGNETKENLEKNGISPPPNLPK